MDDVVQRARATEGSKRGSLELVPDTSCIFTMTLSISQ